MTGPLTLANSVDPLNWNVPIVDPRTGNPTQEFQRKWGQQKATNASIPDLTTVKAVSAVLDIVTSTVGSLLVRGATQWSGLAPAADGRVLRDKGSGNDAIWDTISNILDTIANTRGALLYRSVSGWAVLAPSAAGKVLTDGGVGADPSWQTASGSSGSAASAFFLDGTDGYVGLVDRNGLLVQDSQGRGVYSKDPVLPQAMIPFGITPNIVAFTAVGSTTYTPDTTKVGRIRVHMKAAGGGGCGNGQTSPGTAADGGDASFVPSTGVVTALLAKGGKGASTNDPPAGGSGGSNGSGFSPINIVRIPGAVGNTISTLIWSSTTFGCIAGSGGGKGGGTAAHNALTPNPGKANSGGGGAGAGFPPDVPATVALYAFACGGAEGEEVFFDIINPSGTFNLIVPDGGAGGVGTGTNAMTGAKGGSGGIWIEEFAR